jgi:hypothetical protein
MLVLAIYMRKVRYVNMCVDHAGGISAIRIIIKRLKAFSVCVVQQACSKGPSSIPLYEDCAWLSSEYKQRKYDN